MNTKHSEPFYISSNLFDNRRLKRRLCKWMERLRERQKLYMSNMRSHTHSHTHTHMHTHTHAHTHTPASKTERGKQRRCHLMLSRRHVAATLPADITIDLLSDDDEDEEQTQPVVVKAAAPGYAMASGLLLHHHRAAGVGGTASLQLSTVPNITLVPVELAPAHSSTSTSTMLLMPASSTRAISGRKKAGNTSKRYGDVTSTTTATFSDSIVLTSDDEDGRNDFSRRHIMRSPPPLAPLTFNDTIEEVTVSLVPRNSTIANCQARQRRRQPRDSSFHTGNSHAHAQAQGHAHSQNCNAPTTTLPNSFDGYLNVDVASDVTATLPDETTVHTVIANRIYELSLSKLREGLASSGVPEYTHDILPEQLQKLSPAMRAKVAPMVVPSPPAPISLKLSSDLSISLISDDDDCESGGNNGSGDGGGGGGSSGRSSDLLHPVVAAAEAHAAAKLLKQQQPQLSVVQHLQYPGHGTPVALPVMALAATSPTLVPSTRRRKLG